MNALRHNVAAAMANAMKPAMDRLADRPRVLGCAAYHVYVLVNGQMVEPMEGEPGSSGLSHAAAGLVQGYWGEPESIECQGSVWMSDGTIHHHDCRTFFMLEAIEFCDDNGLPYPSWADPDGRYAREREQERGYEEQVRRDYRSGVGR